LVYSDYIFAVDEIFLNNLPKPEIVLTRPGGALLVNGDSVSFRFENSPELKPGQQYLQFLRLIPQSSAYGALDSFSTLRRNGDSWVLVRASSAVTVPGLTYQNLEATLKDWRNSCK